MMNYGYMAEGSSSMMFLPDYLYAVVTLLVLGIAALWKYINKIIPDRQPT